MDIELTSGAATHVGLIRKVNEDRYVARSPVFVVADGMGGHDRGDVASTMLAAAFEEIAGAGPIDMDVVADLVRTSHQAIREAGHDSPLDREMGTTLVGALIVTNGAEESWLIVNIGDSRAYRYFDGRLTQLSTDHSVVQELIDSGVVSASAAHRHPDRHIITRAVGVHTDLVPDFFLRPPEVGERLLLCSDGVHDELSDTELAAILAHEVGPQEVADLVVAAVLDRGARDNLTVVVIDTVDLREPAIVAAQERTGPVPEVQVPTATTAAAGAGPRRRRGTTDS